MDTRTATSLARDRVAAVVDDPAARRALLRTLYEGPTGYERPTGYEGPTGRERHRLPYRRAASAFMGWQLRRGLLNPIDAASPGSPWWRAVNTRLLRDGWEALELTRGRPGPPSSPGVAAAMDFIERPSAQTWYRAHNLSVVSAYLDHRDLAAQENRSERFFINLVLVRVLYAHTLVAAPSIALGRLAAVAPALGDPRLGMTGIFLSLSRILPDHYPLSDDLDTYIRAEHGFGHLLDVGIITPRLPQLYLWSATELARPDLNDLLTDGIPTYAWPADDRGPWHPAPTRLALAARRALPPTPDRYRQPTSTVADDRRSCTDD